MKLALSSPCLTRKRLRIPNQLSQAGTVSLRSCQQRWGFVKCGTTAHARECGYHGGGGSQGGGAWVIHPGWVQSSFCGAHHVGLFCYQHSKVHCCNDHGHFVQCTTRAERSWRC